MSGPGPNLSDIRVAGNHDRDAVAAMLGRAFADDPAMSYIFPDREQRLKRLPKLFHLLFDSGELAGIRLLTAGGEAATFWRGPGKSHTSTVEMLLQAWPMVRTFGTALGRALSVANVIEANLPSGDYWYLQIAGCDPSAQGKGLGGAAVRAGLERIAGGGLPAYLETATEKNLGFYRTLGFEVTGEWAVPKGGPRFWSMLRV